MHLLVHLLMKLFVLIVQSSLSYLFEMTIVIELLGEGEISWQSALEIISQSYMKGVVSERYAVHKFVRTVPADSLPDDIAKEISRQPERYPGFLVAAAEAKCRESVASKIVKVGEIARRDKWFST